MIGPLAFLVESALPTLIVKIPARDRRGLHLVLCVILPLVKVDFTPGIDNIIYGQAVISRQKEVRVFYCLLAVLIDEGGVFVEKRHAVALEHIGNGHFFPGFEAMPQSLDSMLKGRSYGLHFLFTFLTWRAASLVMLVSLASVRSMTLISSLL